MLDSLLPLCAFVQIVNTDSFSPVWGEIIIPKTSDCDIAFFNPGYRFLFHQESGEVFNFDPPKLIRAKCIALIALTPTFAIMRSITWLVKSIFLSLAGIFNYLDDKEFDEKTRRGISEAFMDSIRAIPYGVKMTGQAALGIFSPLKARRRYGQLERELNRHVDGPHKDKFYLAFCFQPLAHLKKEHGNQEEVEKKLIRSIHFFERIITMISTYSFKSYPSKKGLIEMATTVLKAFAMSVIYAYSFGDIIARNWIYPWTPLKSKYIDVPTYNIAAPFAVPACLKTIWNPLTKKQWDKNYHKQGLRLTHSLSWKVSGGICLGISFSFLANYLHSKANFSKETLYTVAKTLRYGGTASSIKTQTIYEALIGSAASLPFEEFCQFKKLIQDDATPFKTAYPFLSESINHFRNQQTSQSLRQFVLNELEKNQVSISPTLYTLVLELDACWRKQRYPAEKKYDEIHTSIMQALAEDLNLKITTVTRLEGMLEMIVSQLMNLANGSYLIHLPQHALALVKSDNELALLEPCKGLAVLSSKQQREVLTHLLKYYGSDGSISLKISTLSLALQPESGNFDEYLSVQKASGHYEKIK